MKTDWRVIILGLGGIGSGALYWLSRRIGADALVAVGLDEDAAAVAHCKVVVLQSFIYLIEVPAERKRHSQVKNVHGRRNPPDIDFTHLR